VDAVGRGFVMGLTAATEAVEAGLVCLRGFVALDPERNVSEIFDCEFERATVGAMACVC